MTSKQEARDKINAASNACTAAQDEWSAAAAALSGTISTNGYGIHHDRHQLRNKLLDAQEHIQKALALLQDIDWPLEADYDLVD